MFPAVLTFLHYAPLRGHARHRGTAPLSRVLRQTTTAIQPHRKVSNSLPMPQYSEASSYSEHNAVDIIFENENYRDILNPNSTDAKNPVLVFMPGLDAQPLPKSQAEPLRGRYIIVSIRHNPNDRSDWEHLVQASLPTLTTLRDKSPTGLTIVGESFGAALALRVVAACSPDVVQRLVLINSGTAIMNDDLLNSVISLLPILKIDPSERLYKAAAIFLFKVLLAREDRLATSSLPSNDIPFLRSFDTKAAPLDAMLHRVSLLKSFSRTFSNDCIRDLIQVPTILIASDHDRLLRSTEEMERLGELLQNVERKIVLDGSAHAALLEKDVSLASVLEGSRNEVRGRRKRKTKSVDNVAYRAAVARGKKIFGPWLKVTSPLVLGTQSVLHALEKANESVNRRPILFVGNHSVLGLLDLPILFIQLADLLGDDKLRSLADAIHFKQYADVTNGRWGQFVSDLGAVPASARNFYRLLSAGEKVLLFPGGAREVCRRRNEQYRLFWKPDLDFVRPAVKFNALIVPFSAVGADDAVDILIDGQELQQLPYIGSVVQNRLNESKLSKDNLMPIVSFPPRTDRFYFKFHDAIDTSCGNYSDPRFCKTVYEQCRSVVQGGIGELFKLRTSDPSRKLSTRIRKDARTSIPGPNIILNSVASIVESILPSFEP